LCTGDTSTKSKATRGLASAPLFSGADSGEVRVELSTPTKAGIIKPMEIEEGEDLLMLVMPLMLNT
jgi:DNA polymerase III sliding clamp (beta) subunit (PCNA family)